MFGGTCDPTLHQVPSGCVEGLGLQKISQSSRRLLLGAVLALASLAVFTPSTSSPAAAEEQSPIVTAALRHLGTHGGQCWTWMREVVYEATGRTVGFDYRQGFFEAGAVEVSASEATSGDIIQISKDGDTGPWTYYHGQHTAIIMKNLGGGKFDAIDSNQNWDEWVRLRPNYDPYASAARNGLSVHIYRIPGGSSSAAPSVPVSEPASASNWTAGDSAVVATDSGCLNLRTAPNLAGGKITCLPNGVPGKVLEGPVTADGYTWVKLETSAGTGWVASRYLSKTASAPAVVASAPAAADTTESSGSASTELASDVIGIRHVDNSPGCLRQRAAASTDAAIVDCLKAGTRLEVISNTVISANGYDWIKVRTSAGVGWVANAFVE